MERREWTYKYLRGQGYLIGETGRGCIATVADEPTAKSVCDDHNQHTTLVEQRDALVTELRLILSEAEYVGDAKAPFSTWVATHCRNALATVEQGGDA